MTTFSPVRATSPLRTAAVILWPAFVVAGLATGAFFTLVDPLALAAISAPQLGISRVAGYSAGFFMFWAVSSLASGMTWLLLRPAAAAPSSAQDLD
jgi:hypothetical protein